jgi:hypothetical protein
VPTLSEIGGSITTVDLRSALLVVTIAIAYFVYQLIVIFSATAGLDGACMYTFWASDEKWWKNPYWLVIAIVCGLIVLSLFLAVEGVGAGNRTKIVTGLLSVMVLGLWLYNLNGLWNAMLFERGEISPEVWYQNERGARGVALLWEEHVCDPGT